MKITLVNPEVCLVMIKGLYLNGHEYTQGTHIQYFPYVQVRRRGQGLAPGEGGSEGSSTAIRLGTINMIYTFGFDSDPATAHTFVEITNIPVLGLIRSLVETSAIDRDKARMDGFTRDPKDTVMINADSITHRIKLVPHFTDPERMLAIRMWEAR